MTEEKTTAHIMVQTHHADGGYFERIRIENSITQTFHDNLTPHGRFILRRAFEEQK